MVVLEVIVHRGQFPERFDKYLSGNRLRVIGSEDEFMKLTRSSALKYFTMQCVSLNGEVIKERKTKVRPDDIITINIGEHHNDSSNYCEELTPCPEDIKLNILYQDSELLVLNKDAGMLVNPPNLKEGSIILNSKNHTHTLSNILLAKYGKDGISNLAGLDRPGIVHRLDKDTSGLMVVAKNNKIHKSLKDLFEKHTQASINLATKSSENGIESTSKSQVLIERISKFSPHTIQKKYYCLVIGTLKQEHGIITKPISRHPKDKNKMVINEKSGKESITEYKVIKVWNKVEVNMYDQQSVVSKSTNQDDSNEYDNIISKLKSKKKVNQSSKSNQKSQLKYLSIDDDEDDDEDEDEDDEDDEEEEDEEDSDYDSDNEFDNISDNSEDSEDSEELSNIQRKIKKSSPLSFSLVEIILHTGRSHQIRVHMACEGNPIIGDNIYSHKGNQFITPYLLLSAMNMEFKHPISQNPIKCSIDFPKHFKDFIDVLDEQSKLNNQSSQKLISNPSFEISNYESLYQVPNITNTNTNNNNNNSKKNTKNNLNNDLKNIIAKKSPNSTISAKQQPPSSKSNKKTTLESKENDFDQLFFSDLKDHENSKKNFKKK